MFIQSLTNTASIPVEVDQALRDRLGIDSTATFSVGGKGADTEDVSVNESGSSTYTVLNDPVGFIALRLNNTTYYIPYYS